MKVTMEWPFILKVIELEQTLEGIEEVSYD